MKMAATASRPSTATGSAARAAGSAEGKKAIAMPQAESLKQRWRGAGNLLPALLFLGLFFLAPLIGLLLRGVLEPVPGLGNYEQLFANSAYPACCSTPFRWPGW